MLEMLIAAMLSIASLQTPSKPAASDPPAKSLVVLTGCVVSSTEGKDTRFMLINARPASAGGKDSRAGGAPETGSTGVGTTGTGTSGTGTSPSPTPAQDSAQVSVLLTSERNVRLDRHLNRRVEVQGTMMPGSAAPGAGVPREVRVTKLRRLASPCSERK
jgi:hypothetical protein